MHRSKLSVFFLVVASAILALLATRCDAAPAHFWLSSSSVAPAGPGVATNIETTQGTVGSLHIWGRSATERKLRNISLNLVALQAGIDFIDASITMHNNAGGGRSRFEYTSDASSSPALLSEESLFDVAVSGQPDAIEQLQGYSLSESNANIRGVGSQCVGGEVGCVIAGDGLPAWLVASVDYNAIVGGPVTEVYLQIGEHGINHESLVPGDYDLNGVVNDSDFAEVQDNFSSTVAEWPDGNGNGRVDAADFTISQDHFGAFSEFESASLTTVRFGPGAVDYNGVTDREVTLFGDTADATITIVPPLSALGTAVPEPATEYILAVALAVAAGFTRRTGNQR